MIMTENTNSGCSQRDSAEHEGYAKASRSFNLIWKERDSAHTNTMRTWQQTAEEDTGIVRI